MLADPHELVGQVVGGYHLIRLLGTGGMSLVFLGERADNPTVQVAVKVLHSPTTSRASQATFRARFRREAQAASQLRDEHIVSVETFGETDGLPYMVMPLITGGTLASRLAHQQQPLPLTQVVAYARQVASALDYAHAHGIIHRDVKPTNILLDAQGRALLTDFGIARLFEGNGAIGGPDDPEPLTSLTTTGEVLGTPAYMAPEQIRGESVGPATDVYSLGIVLYQLVCGRVPFTGDSAFAVASRHLHERPPAPRTFRPDLPEPAAAALLHALEKDPAARFTSAGALVKAFEEGLAGRWANVLLPAAVVSDQEPTMADVPLISPTTAMSWGYTAGAAKLVARPHTPAAQRALAAVLWAALALVLLFGGVWMVAHAAQPTASTSAPPVTGIATATITPVATPSLTVRADRDHVYGIDANGKTVWTQHIDGRIIGQPTVQDGIVYVQTQKNGTVALRLADGTYVNAPQVSPTATADNNND